jgi:hypothetical protein
MADPRINIPMLILCLVFFIRSRLSGPRDIIDRHIMRASVTVVITIDKLTTVPSDLRESSSKLKDPF